MSNYGKKSCFNTTVLVCSCQMTQSCMRTLSYNLPHQTLVYELSLLTTRRKGRAGRLYPT